ncbi:MAG: carboxypeptidase-like regulatory domain-containing protein [Saprospiraceae bacterium]
MALRIILFLSFICLTSAVHGQQAKLVDHLDVTASYFGYSLIYSSSSIPDTSIAFSIVDSASAKTSFDLLTEPFGLTYNLLANQAIITTTRRELLTFSGFVQDATTGERLVGAAVYIEGSTRGTYTNGYGYFSLRKISGSDVVTIKYLGYPAKRVVAESAKGGQLTIRLRASYLLDLVEIFPVEDELGQLPNAGRSIPIGLLRKTEYTRGCPDLNAWLNLQPGITSSGSGFRGFSIRGADPDHNLILLDDAPLYLPSHLSGYMSIVPGEAIKSVQLHKNAGSARYGDRIGGVLDIRLRDGSTEKRRSELSFGLTDIRFNTEGPVGKGSYFVSGRRGLTDFWIKALTPTIQPQRSRIPNINYVFYDVAGKINYPIGPRQRIYASIFLGSNQYQEDYRTNQVLDNVLNEYENDSNRSWSNLVSSLRYNLTIGSRWFANTTLTVSQFNYDASDLIQVIKGIDLLQPGYESSQYINGTRLKDFGLRQDAEFAWTERLSLKLGVDAVQHRFQVGTKGNVDTALISAEDELELVGLKNTYDVSSYVYLDWKMNNKLGLNLGLRGSGQLGGEETFLALLPRLAFEYAATEDLAFHGDAGMSRQYIHQVSTLNPGLPRDLWVPSVNGLTPQENRYVSLGMSFESKKNFAFSADVFANEIDGLSRFGNGLTGGRLQDWSNSIRRGSGYSYGLEAKHTGNLAKIQYDMSYTFMVSNRSYENESQVVQPEERFIFDRRHFYALSTRYAMSDSWGFGVTWSIGSGLPARLPDRSSLSSEPPPRIKPLTNPWGYLTDAVQLKPYHSLDLGFRYTKMVKTNIYNLSFGVQNVYLRRNHLFINLQAIDVRDNGKSLYGETFVSSFPILPFIRYGISF